ncbi:MAG: hypothetical protein JSS75_05015 [Bacteroidetes bacterium]|nr:hypothetical protein [Bacteroidota bacterium]
MLIHPIIRTVLIAAACILFADSRSAVAQTSTGHWVKGPTFFEDSMEYGKIVFADSLHGYFFGARNIYVLKKSNWADRTWYRTVDGGESWQKLDPVALFAWDSALLEQPGDVIVGEPTPISANELVFTNAWGVHNAFHDTIVTYRSTDNGTTWTRKASNPVVSRGTLAEEAITKKDEVITMRMDDLNLLHDEGKLFISSNEGAVFTLDKRWDSTLLYNISQLGFGKTGKFNQVNNHAFTIRGDGAWVISVPDSNNAASMDTKRPFSWVTLISTDEGHHWVANRGVVPRIPSDHEIAYLAPQAIANSSWLYAFSGYGEGGNPFNHYMVASGFPVYGVNYAYSSDDGQSWQIDTSFGTNRRPSTSPTRPILVEPGISIRAHS